MASVDFIADRLTHEVRADGVAFHAGLLELSALGIAVFLVRLGDFEVIAPAGEFHAVVAKGLGLLEHGSQRQISPLAGE